MRGLLFAVMVFWMFGVESIAAPVNPNQRYIQPYQRDDGTQVRGHWRTVPNDRTDDNINAPRGNYSSLIDYR